MRLILPTLLFTLLAAPAVAAPITAPAPAAAPSSVPAPALTPVLPAISSLRAEDAGQTWKLSVALPQMVVFQERSNATAWRLYLPGVSSAQASFPADPVLGTLKVISNGEGTTLELPWKYWCPTDYEITDSPARLTVTFKKVYREVRTDALATGVSHEHIRQADANGPLNIHVLRVDPRQPGVRVEPALANRELSSKLGTVSTITRTYGAIAGVNAGYFNMNTGQPLGLLMINGELISAPLFNRSALALGANGEAFVGNTQLTNQLVVPSGEIYDFDGVNQQRGLNRMVLFTRHFGASTQTTPGGKEYSLLPDGTVLSVQDCNTPIPLGGSVISAHGQAAQWLDRYVKVGTKLTVRSPLNDFWPGVKHALGGGPTLVRAGNVLVTALEEQFKPDITQGLAPRTAVGLLPSGEMLIVTVDGRQPSVSRGLSLTGLAYLLQQMGATEGINLDGGGSTAMAIGPTVVNRPSDGVERRVNNALLVYAQNPTGVVVKPDMGWPDQQAVR
jgi:exopolysaccharide biosynthesis protein